MLLGLIAAVILGMQVYAKRGLEAAVKVGADQIGNQVDGMKYESGDRQNKVFAAGVVLKRETATRNESDAATNTKVLLGGGTQLGTAGASQNFGDLDPGTYGPDVSAYSEVIIDVVD